MPCSQDDVISKDYKKCEKVFKNESHFLLKYIRYLT